MKRYTVPDAVPTYKRGFKIDRIIYLPWGVNIRVVRSQLPILKMNEGVKSSVTNPTQGLEGKGRVGPITTILS